MRIKNILIGIAVVLLIVGFATILYWNRSLKMEVQKRTQEIDSKNSELQKLNDIKNKFLGMAAHDLRSPLGSIMGFTEMIIEMKLDEEEKQEYLQTIAQVSRQMLSLINDLLDVSSIESGKFEMVLNPANLKELIESRIKLHRFAAQAKEIISNLQGFPDFKFDKDRIAQVLDNLFGNVIKFSEPGTTIEVSLNENGQKATFNIKDQGSGISSQEINKIFGEFQKLSNKPTGGEKSTGLGMAIVKKIVDGHNVLNSVESEIGKGTVFFVSLPLSSKGI